MNAKVFFYFSFRETCASIVYYEKYFVQIFFVRATYFAFAHAHIFFILFCCRIKKCVMFFSVCIKNIVTRVQGDVVPLRSHYKNDFPFKLVHPTALKRGFLFYVDRGCVLEAFLFKRTFSLMKA